MNAGLRREVLGLVLAVLLVDAIFIGAYVIGGLQRAPDPVKLGFTALWTLITLGVVMRGLLRVRRARLDSGPSSRSE